MKSIKRLSALFLVCIVFMSSVATFPVVATDGSDYGEARYNFMLVIDRSTSLDTYDSEGYRFGAIEYFLTTMRDAGNEYGAIVFNNKITPVSPIHPINSQGEKDELYEKIKDEKPLTGGTDINAALLAAVEALTKKEEEQVAATGTHLKSVIILFTDGLPDSIDRAASKENRKKVIDIAKLKEIDICGVFLNDKNNIKYDPENEGNVFDIVRDARNRIDDPTVPRKEDGSINDLDNMYAEIVDSTYTVGSFATLVGRYADGAYIGEEINIPPSITKKCIVPGIGVSELSFGIRYSLGTLEKLSVKVIRPNGEPVDEKNTNEITFTKTGVFYNVKIRNPDSGKWVLTVGLKDGVDGASVKVAVDAIINTNVSAKLKDETPEGGAILNRAIPFQVWLEQAGAKLDDRNNYAYFNCRLTIINSGTEEPKEIIQNATDVGGFTFNEALSDNKAYTVSATFFTDEEDNDYPFSFRSNEVSLRVVNREPTITPNPIKDNHSYNWLFGKTYNIDLSKFVTDLEGGVLTYTIGDSDFPGAVLDGSELLINTKDTGEGKIQLSVKDDQAAVVNFTLELTVSNNSWLITLVLVILVLLLAAIIFFVIRKIFGGYIDAKLQISIENSDNTAINEKYAYGDPTQVLLINFNHPSVTLYAACSSILDRVSDEVKEALSDLFNSNKAILNKCEFKRVPGFDRRKFIFSNRSEDTKREPYEIFIATVVLSDDERIKIVCHTRENHDGRSKENEYDD